jgi:hypothetical protein
MLKLTDRVLKLVAGVTVFAAMSGTAWAGPPLICHPFDAGSASLLPWGSGSSWNTPDASYDLQKLTADTLRLLTPTAPVLARMENMRRATIYAGKDRKVAAALLKAVIDRAKAAPSGSANAINAMPWFDAGYLIESYRQMEGTAKFNMLADSEALLAEFRNAPHGAEGYGLVLKALQFAGQNPEMEFAAFLMQRGTVAAEHRRRAEAGAPKGSLLAKNLASFSQ